MKKSLRKSIELYWKRDLFSIVNQRLDTIKDSSFFSQMFETMVCIVDDSNKILDT